MKTVHRGHEITVTREKCLGGYRLIYYSVFRVDDGYECASGCIDTSDTPRTLIESFKRRVDAELESEHPWE